MNSFRMCVRYLFLVLAGVAVPPMLLWGAAFGEYGTVKAASDAVALVFSLDRAQWAWGFWAIVWAVVSWELARGEE